MKAVLMAGGDGARLRPLTVGRPKPMVPVVNKTVMNHILELLRSHGVTEVIVTLRYLASVIQDAFEDGSQPGSEAPLCGGGDAAWHGGECQKRRPFSGRYLYCHQR
jgi:NDP-sugar pyrophosphorylase family protein